ncbi:glycosyltransferase family 41 protein, partial [Accumulibacter sp.]|uniref:O-linked N-acetylglucosamine transferase, SPINDLY family protein n=1 Tax=Accumulibacter sp. TaxID=2053492 RepID=UPI0025F80593
MRRHLKKEPVGPGTLGVPEAIKVALAHHQAGRFAEADLAYQRLVRSRPEDPDAWHLWGVLAAENGQYAVAVERIQRALELSPRQAAFLGNLGHAFLQLAQAAQAIACYREVVELQPDDSEFRDRLNRICERQLDLGIEHQKAGRLTEAEDCYQDVLRGQPERADAWHLKGLIEMERGHHAAALEHVCRAIDRAPDTASFHNSLASVHERLQHFEAAIACYRHAITLRPDYPEAHHNLGNLLYRRRQLGEALACFERVLALDPDHAFAQGMAADCRARMGLWADHESTRQRLAERVRENAPVVEPFIFLNFCDDPSAQRQCAELFVSSERRVRSAQASATAPFSHERIRLAYISPDFGDHPVAYLIADLIEQHDRRRFEVFGVAIGRQRQGSRHERLKRAFDRFLDLRSASDAAAAQQLVDLEVDIAIDLAGYTGSSRPGIFAARAAPIQVNYLGFPGTMGAESIDYILADRFVIPEAHEPFYAEKVVRLPDTFQCCPPRPVADATPARREAGLPEKGFVFCCFNNSYKINPQMFDIWMRLLKQVEGSVLWLSKANQEVVGNLRREAQGRGVDADRLVFASRVTGLDEHLARQRLADLFLDTLPYNAHTTAGDALWAGLPVLTCLGNAFAGRVAASLLHAVGLPELVTDSLADYEALAQRLATRPDEYAAIREKLER